MLGRNVKISTLIDEAAIATGVREMAGRIAEDYQGKEPLLVPLLRGSFVFAADLVRALYREGCSPQVDFLTLSSYGDGTQSSGLVEIHRDMDESVQGRDVVLVDDILESARTLHLARQLMVARKAATVRIAVLLEKPGKRANTPETLALKADYVGFTIPDKFVVGYGLDYANRYRELPFIGVVEE